MAFLLIGEGKRVIHAGILPNRVFNGVRRNPGRGVAVGAIDNPTAIIGISAGDGTLEKRTPRLQKRIDELTALITGVI